MKWAVLYNFVIVVDVVLLDIIIIIIIFQIIIVNGSHFSDCISLAL